MLVYHPRGLGYVNIRVSGVQLGSNVFEDGDAEKELQQQFPLILV